MKLTEGLRKYVKKLTEKNNKYRINFNIIVITLIQLFLYEIIYANFFYGINRIIDDLVYGTYTCIFNIIIINVVKNVYESKNNETLKELNRQIEILKITKEELRVSEKKLRQVTENNLDVICTTDADMRVTYISGVGFKELGYSSSEMIGCSMLNHIHEEDIPKAKKVLHDLFEKKEIKPTEYRCRCKDGNYIWLETTGNLLECEKTNIQAIFSTRNINVRKKAEQALIESENKFRELFNKANDSILVHEFLYEDIENFPQGKILEINEVTCKLLGYSKEEILKMKVKDIFKSVECSDSKEFVKQLISNGEVTFIAYYIAKNGEKVLAENNSSICEIEGKKVIMTISRDLTERMKMEEERKLLNEQVQYEKLKTEFFANISHELKTPINVILAAEQLMWSISQNGHNRESCGKLFQYMKMIKQNCFRLIRLVNNLIDITKIDSGYLKPSFKNCNIVSVVEDISLSVAAYIENKGINLVFDTDVEEKIIACDEEKIERIILNLLSNSVKFTDAKGSIFININDKGSSVVISVRDTGIGIPEDKKDAIFNRFVQVDKTFSRNAEGSGIGLSLVKALVEMHKGTISLKSELNKGSEFTIELPCKLIDSSQENDIVLRGAQEKMEKVTIEFSDIYQL